MRLHFNEVIVTETPRFLIEAADEITHAILISDTATDHPYVIPHENNQQPSSSLYCISSSLMRIRPMIHTTLVSHPKNSR